MSILVAGEALIDFFPANCGKRRGFVPFPGGSPYNVTVGLGRLGVPVGFLGKISKDFFGRMLRTHLEENGVDLRYLQQGPQPSALAFVQRGEEDEPEFSFYGGGTADYALCNDALPSHLSRDVNLIHLGSIAMVHEPGGSTLTALMEREHGRRLISFDPNVRPSCIPDRQAYVERLRTWISLSDLVKVSQSGLNFLYPDTRYEEIVKYWLQLGPKLVVVTKGANGAEGFTHDGPVSVEGVPVKVVDTVGAGDAFTAGLLAWLHNAGLLKMGRLAKINRESLQGALRYAVRVAALTCSRMGASPPYRAEVEAVD